VGSFLAELANMRRIVTVSNVRLRANTSQDPNLSTAAELTASAYNLNTNPQPVAPAPAPKKPNPDGHVEE
jgi:Tfp pilus assembly protein PilO